MWLYALLVLDGTSFPICGHVATGRKIVHLVLGRIADVHATTLELYNCIFGFFFFFFLLEGGRLAGLIPIFLPYARPLHQSRVPGTGIGG